MTKKDIDDIISIICPNDEDFEKTCISPAYLKKELEVLALEQEPVLDKIRTEITKLQTYKMFEGEDTVYVERDDVLEVLKQEPCEDCISRQAAIDGLASIAKAKARSDAQKSLMGRVIFFTEHLPPVTPQPKTGHWEKHSYFKDAYICSSCNTGGNMVYKDFKYCPNCGAKMEVEDNG